MDQRYIALRMAALALLVLLAVVLPGSLTAAANSAPVASAVGSDSKGAVVVLTDSNFEELVRPATGENGDWLIEFYAPWCGHCKTLAPTWDKLATSLASHPTLHVAKLDATAELSSARRFDVRGFPSILLVSRGRVFEHRGGRSLDALTAFALSSLGKPAAEGAPLPGPPAGWQLALDGFLQLATEVQGVVLRKPLAAAVFALGGALLGVVGTVLLFALCCERAPQEFVRFTDATTGQVRVVPYVRAAASPAPSPATSPIAPAAAAADGRAQKKQQ